MCNEAGSSLRSMGVGGICFGKTKTKKVNARSVNCLMRDEFLVYADVSDFENGWIVLPEKIK